MYRVVLACVTLLLYLVTMVAGDVALLTCNCSAHRVADGHNHCAVDHIHASCSNCQSCADESFDANVMLSSNDCKCNHSHSDKIVLYIQPRVDNQDAMMRMLASVAMSSFAGYCLESPALEGLPDYNRYLLPPLRAAHSSGLSLRAPPTLI